MEEPPGIELPEIRLTKPLRGALKVPFFHVHKFFEISFCSMLFISVYRVKLNAIKSRKTKEITILPANNFRRTILPAKILLSKTCEN